MKFENLTIIGTSHIARESIDEIKKLFEEDTPHIAAIELDHQRYIVLTSGKRQKPSILAIPKVGLHGFLFLVLGHWAQGALGKMVGVEPGSEMLTTIRLAKKHKVSLALVDQDIQITLKRFSTIPFRERIRLIWDVVTSVFSKGPEMQKLGITSIDLSKVPDKLLISKLMALMRKRYPHLYKVLVEERNVYMARNLTGIMLSNPDKKLLAVMGAGHEEDILNLVKLYTTHARKLKSETV